METAGIEIPTIKVFDATPHPDFLLSLLRNSALTVPRALCELIDNAWDANARCVEITISPEECSVHDDGEGCADMERMIKLGARQTKLAAIGRYGVGLKEVAAWMAERIEIDSRCSDNLYGCHVSWLDLSASGKWKFEGYEPRRSPGPAYTRIRMLGLYPGRIRRARADLKERIGYFYYPALRRRKHIILNGGTIEPFPLPKFEESIERSGEFKGRPWKMVAGICDPGPWGPGYTVGFRDRIIIEHSTEGTGDLVARRFFAYVEISETLESRWGLDRLKYGMEESEEFLGSLFPICRPLIEKAQTAGRELRLDKLAKELSGIFTLALRETVRRIRERRNPKKDLTGTVSPKESGKKREKAEKVHPESPGSILEEPERRKASKVVVAFADLADDALADVQQDSHKTTVTLNTLHPLFCGKDPDPTVIASIAFPHIVAWAFTHGQYGQEKLGFEAPNGRWFDEFTSKSGQLLASHLRISGLELTDKKRTR